MAAIGTVKIVSNRPVKYSFGELLLCLTWTGRCRSGKLFDWTTCARKGEKNKCRRDDGHEEHAIDPAQDHQ